MRGAAGWIAALVVGGALVAGLIAVLQSRDESAVDPPAADTAPGSARTVRLPPDLERAVRAGNVVVLHRTTSAPAGLGTDDPSLRAAGQAVIARRAPGLERQLVAVAAERQLAGDRAGDLREFVDYWLGGR